MCRRDFEHNDFQRVRSTLWPGKEIEKDFQASSGHFDYYRETHQTLQCTGGTTLCPSASRTMIRWLYRCRLTFLWIYHVVRIWNVWNRCPGPRDRKSSIRTFRCITRFLAQYSGWNGYETLGRPYRDWRHSVCRIRDVGRLEVSPVALA